MKLYKSLAGLIVLSVLLSTGAWAEVSWDQVQKKARDAKSYQLTYSYKGPRGELDFDYAYAGDKIRTEIVRAKSDPSKKGTVIVYDKSWKPDMVRARIGGGEIIRKNSHKDVENTPFYQSIFEMIFSQTDKCGKPSAKAQGDKTQFTFKCPGYEYKIWANADGEIIKTEREVDHVTETRRFMSYRWNSNPMTDF